MPRLRPLVFDDRSDVAAVVYRAGDDPDRLLAGFLRDLHGQGFDAVGVLQHRRPTGTGDAASVTFDLFPDAGTPTDPLPSPAPVGAALQDRGNRLAALVEERPDIVVLNRFGWQELNGAGLIEVLDMALAREVPVAIAVPEPLFARWLELSRGLAVRVPCDRAGLDRWWRALWQPSRSRATVCDRYK
ncbi:DUF2478 domain-containing protein [Azospirillum argentinense]